MDKPYIYKKVSGSIIIFLVLYIDDILLIENDVSTLQSIKIWIKIYRDRFKQLLSLTQSMYINKMLK